MMKVIKQCTLVCLALLALASYAFAANCRLKRIADYPSDMVLIPPSDWDSLEIVKDSGTEREIVRTVVNASV